MVKLPQTRAFPLWATLIPLPPVSSCLIPSANTLALLYEVSRNNPSSIAKIAAPGARAQETRQTHVLAFHALDEKTQHSETASQALRRCDPDRENRVPLNQGSGAAAPGTPPQRRVADTLTTLVFCL